MPTPVQVTNADTAAGRVIRVGGTFNGKPWSMSAANVIAEVERPAITRQWDFDASAHGVVAPVRVTTRGGRKVLEAEGVDLLSLPACPPERRDDT
jgi:hypothetical protein